MSDEKHGAGANAPGALVLFAPWRLSYMKMLSAKDAPTASTGVQKGACFLREYWLNPADDEKNHVIVRTGTERTGRGGLILLNKYPYANGHVLVCLGEGRPRLLDYDEGQRQEFWSLVDLAVDLVERTLNPQGVNVGVNQGSAAGAGVPEHVHAHVVPRWAGDVNFMSVCANVRVIPGALEAMAGRMREAWGGIAATTTSLGG
jgi:ATP adenylyltransferase